MGRHRLGAQNMELFPYPPPDGESERMASGTTDARDVRGAGSSEMGEEREALVRRHIEWAWQDEAARARVHTEACISRELERLDERGLRDRNALRGSIARAVRAEGIRIVTRRLQICLKAFAESDIAITSDRVDFIEASVRGALQEWIGARRPYLGAKLRSISIEPHDRLMSEVFWDVRRAVQRELEIVRTRHLLYSESPDDGVSVQGLARARVLPCSASDIVGGREVARRLAAISPSLGDSYLQVAADLSRADRFTYAGPISELRAVILASVEQLAPDDRVRAWLDQIPESADDGERPSLVQKVRFVMYHRSPVSDGNGMARAVENLLENTLPGFVNTYHETTQLVSSRALAREEAIRLFRYADSLLRQLLPSADHRWLPEDDFTEGEVLVPGETVASMIEPVRHSE